MSTQKILLDGDVITTVGELRQILAPFVDECEINPITVYYISFVGDNPAMLKIEQSNTGL